MIKYVICSTIISENHCKLNKFGTKQLQQLSDVRPSAAKELVSQVQVPYMNGLVQESRNSSALATEVCLSCTNPLIWEQNWNIFESNISFYIW